jgi:hypothetical protein
MFARKHLIIAVVIACPVLYACSGQVEKKPQPVVQQRIPVRKDNTEASPLDKSPMDMSYFPNDYPIMKMSGKIKTPPVARLIYSRPSKDGRVIFGNLVKYGEPWRLGANEATEIEFFQDVLVQNRKVKKGRYVLYCIPYPDKWTIVLNSDLYVWGLKIHSAKDVARFDVPAQSTDHNYDIFTMDFEQAGAGTALVMAWDTVKASLPIRF